MEIFFIILCVFILLLALSFLIIGQVYTKPSTAEWLEVCPTRFEAETLFGLEFNRLSNVKRSFLSRHKENGLQRINYSTCLEPREIYTEAVLQGINSDKAKNLLVDALKSKNANSKLVKYLLKDIEQADKFIEVKAIDDFKEITDKEDPKEVKIFNQEEEEVTVEVKEVKPARKPRKPRKKVSTNGSKPENQTKVEKEPEVADKNLPEDKDKQADTSPEKDVKEINKPSSLSSQSKEDDNPAQEDTQEKTEKKSPVKTPTRKRSNTTRAQSRSRQNNKNTQKKK